MPALELSALDLSQRHLATLRALLAVHTPHAHVWAYGSRVKGTAHEGSDLDLVLRHPADLNEAVPGWANLQEALRASNLPMIVDVHQWAHLPTAFRANIETGYVVISQ
jgi:predicted nucleotidyltransferase